MRNFILVLLFLFPCQFLINAQDVTKIKVFTGNAVFPADVAFVSYNPESYVGYNIFETAGRRSFGAFIVDNAQNITNSKSYQISGRDIAFIKFCPFYSYVLPGNVMHALAALGEGAFSTGLWSPVLIEIDKATGLINWAKKITIPNINNYLTFFPEDISVSGNTVKILASALVASPPAGSPRSKMIVVTLTLGSYNYSISEMYCTSNLNYVFNHISFIKSQAYSTRMYYTGSSDLAISGISQDDIQRKGFIFEKDSFANIYFKSYLLNNKQTIGFQVNSSDVINTPPGSSGLNICIQNSDYEISFHRPLDLFNSTLTWTKHYQNTDAQFWLTNYGHGIKHSGTSDEDYFIGLYNQAQTIPDGYSFIKINSATGVPTQHFYYDLSLNFTTPVRSYFRTNTSYATIVAPGLQYFGEKPYLYLIDRNLADIPDEHCEVSMPFVEIPNTLSVTDELITTNQSAIYNSTDIAIAVSTVSTRTSIHCSEGLAGGKNLSNVSTAIEKGDAQINVANNKIVIRTLDKHITKVSIYAMDGKLIRSQNFSGERKANLYNSGILSRGIYVIRIQFSDKTFDSQKIMIN